MPGLQDLVRPSSPTPGDASAVSCHYETSCVRDELDTARGWSCVVLCLGVERVVRKFSLERVPAKRRAGGCHVRARAGRGPGLLADRRRGLSRQLSLSCRWPPQTLIPCQLCCAIMHTATHLSQAVTQPSAYHRGRARRCAPRMSLRTPSEVGVLATSAPHRSIYGLGATPMRHTPRCLPILSQLSCVALLAVCAWHMVASSSSTFLLLPAYSSCLGMRLVVRA